MVGMHVGNTELGMHGGDAMVGMPWWVVGGMHVASTWWETHCGDRCVGGDARWNARQHVSPVALAKLGDAAIPANHAGGTASTWSVCAAAGLLVVVAMTRVFP